MLRNISRRFRGKRDSYVLSIFILRRTKQRMYQNSRALKPRDFLLLLANWPFAVHALRYSNNKPRLPNDHDVYNGGCTV